MWDIEGGALWMMDGGFCCYNHRGIGDGGVELGIFRERWTVEIGTQGDGKGVNGLWLLESCLLWRYLCKFSKGRSWRD